MASSHLLHMQEQVWLHNRCSTHGYTLHDQQITYTVDSISLSRTCCQHGWTLLTWVLLCCGPPGKDGRRPVCTSR